MYKVLILGGSGMLGHTLFRHLAGERNLDVFTTVRSSKVLSDWRPRDQMKKVRQDIDIHQMEGLVEVFGEVKPDIVINCIGIIKQIPEAEDPIETITINALLPHRIASLCSKAGVRMIHISTDCVFDGEKGNYAESDVSNARDLYGRAKYLGEVAYPHCITLRTSIIGHELKGNYGLLEWFLSQKDGVRGFRNVIYSGFPTIELSQIIADYVIPNSEMSGLYHVSSNPISKYELLKLINAQYGKNINIEPEDGVRSDRSLNSSVFRSLTGYSPPTWEELINEMYQDYLQGPYHNG
ncbi:SDR family oxidoreductase [Desulfosporosinus sp. FKA]|uniref:dTDP-4-dehydrorhamnose reductase family protein n=1 Tax=Desulfosporosinus sp. FKA TaxID=1969834 RepID=UPI000B4A0046|nr:SDR family oxidoreductase [Desulfosporosinus sp. FKA]